ncbi:hypothetical protein NDU88_004589 [Pleurodeles waltl]|uniref:B30.2/SPRY domain-containing protein n=1 Tax=Pleurodeles waltl TaxID=8319 RepID=A0AAV7V5J9_PLEWA|nr:hypothetical protein NDU88_004589 [Pleurodeles waltl]
MTSFCNKTTNVDLDELRQRVCEKQMVQKHDYDSRKYVNDVQINVNDWVLIKKPYKVSKGTSKFSLPVKVIKVTKYSVLLEGKGWWNRNCVVPISSPQAEIFKHVYAGREDDTSSSSTFIEDPARKRTEDRRTGHENGSNYCQVENSCDDHESNSAPFPVADPVYTRRNRSAFGSARGAQESFWWCRWGTSRNSSSIGSPLQPGEKARLPASRAGQRHRWWNGRPDWCASVRAGVGLVKPQRQQEPICYWHRCKKVTFQGPESEMKKRKEKEVIKTLKAEEEMKKCKVMVTLDPDTAHPRLLLSEGGRHVRWTGTAQPLLVTPKRFTSSLCVPGIEGFTSGRHYWEVQLLQEGGGWTVGVATESVERKRGITWSPEGGVWAVRRGWDGRYRALTSTETPLSPRERPLKLGVYLDYEEGRLSMYNADSMELLYTFFQTPFTHRLFPIFCLWVGAELRLV